MQDQPDLRSLPAATRDLHAQIMAHVDRLPVIAGMLDDADIAAVGAELELECEFIKTQLVPHMEAEENDVYDQLDRLMERRHSMEPMREEHARLRGLFNTLCNYRGAVERGEFRTDDKVALRRVLFRLYSLLRVHLAEEELYLSVIDRDLSADEKDSLARVIDHAANQPV